MILLHRIPLLLSALLLAVQPAIGAVVEQGFAVKGNSIVEVSVNGEVFSGPQLDDFFIIESAQGYFRYMAKAGAFDGTEVLELRAFAMDEAGNLSLEPAVLNLGKIDTTVPQTPDILELKNPVSDRYASGFSLPVGAIPVLTINGLPVQPDEIKKWFSVNTQSGIDLFEALPGVFDGSEVVEVSAYQRDVRGNESSYADLVRLRPIDTLSPDAPRIFSLDELVAIQTPTKNVDFNRVVTSANTLDSNEIVVQKVLDNTQSEPKLSTDADDFESKATVGVDAANDDIDAIIANILGEPIHSDDFGVQTVTNVENVDAVAINDEFVADVLSEPQQSVSKEQGNPQELLHLPEYSNDEPDFVLVDPPASQKKVTERVPERSSNAPNTVATHTTRSNREVFTLKSAGDTQGLLDWMRLDSLFTSCPISETANSATLVEILNCLDRMGYPNSRMIELPDGIQIDTGERIRVNSASLPSSTSVPELAFTEEVTEWSTIQGYGSGMMLAATNGLDPFELLNIDKEDLKDIDESVVMMPPMNNQPITYVFDLRKPEDTQRLLSWMRRESEPLTCALLDNGNTSGSVDEILSCLDTLGFPKAQSIELSDGVRIDTGERMRIESVGVNQVLDPSLLLPQRFMQDLENKPLSKSRYVKAIDRLEGLGFVRNGSFDYYAKEPGVYDAELVGEAGQSQLSLGASLTSSGKLFGAVKGRHFFNYRGLHYLDYRVGSDIDGQYEIDLSTPLYYDLNNQVDLEFMTSPMDYRYFTSRTTELASRWMDYSGKSSLHLTEALLGVSFHESDPKSGRGLTPQVVADQTLLRAELKAGLSSGLLDGDKVYFGVDGGHNLSVGSGYLRADIDYDTGRIPVAQSDFMINARVSGSALLGGKQAVPLDQRLYLGGPDSVRGVKASYLGSSKDLHLSGGEQRIVSQVELFKPTTLFEQTVDLGVHFDAGNLWGGGDLEDSTAMSLGLFGRADLTENTSAYAYISRSNVESDAQSLLGISIIRKF